jgi:hypothetical protein
MVKLLSLKLQSDLVKDTQTTCRSMIQRYHRAFNTRRGNTGM